MVQFLLLLMFYLRELTLYIMWDYDHGTIPPSLNVLFKRTNTVHNYKTIRVELLEVIYITLILHKIRCLLV